MASTNDWRFIEVGRLVLIRNGKYTDKVAVIVDLVDQNRILVTSPKIEGKEAYTGIPRHVITLKNIEPTPVKIENCPKREAKLMKAMTDQGAIEAWAGSTWAKKISIRKARANVDDITRFRIRRARSIRAYKTRKAFQEKLKAAGMTQKAAKAFKA
eukprot:TRINITY_DN197_c0_g1_i1.p2 TRINITY_DN197_c0_g1~~TRINITY_DN197_c0_g1_i1.p2  ORF type:complete len:175 (+),score=69.99 TRINITY_DN197_c0_g1_i1:58-525(+)